MPAGQTAVLSFRLRYNLQSRKRASLAVSIWQSDPNDPGGCAGRGGQLIDANRIDIFAGERDVSIDVAWHGGESEGITQSQGYLAPTISLWEVEVGILRRFSYRYRGLLPVREEADASSLIVITDPLDSRAG